MSARDDGGPAFPYTREAMPEGEFFYVPAGAPVALPGMSLRDYFAAAVLPSLVTSLSATALMCSDKDAVALVAYLYANAMLKARETEAE